MYALISPFSSSFDEVWFTYKVPEVLQSDVKEGMIAYFPFWKKHIYGVILQLWNTPFWFWENLKEILWVYSHDIFLSHQQITLLQYIAKHYFCFIHQATWLFFPKNLLEKIQKNTFCFHQKKYQYDYNNTKQLNQDQKEILKKILTQPQTPHLIYGVTWSGKTEIYIHLIHQMLQEGKQTLLLLPEIILSEHISKRIQDVFWKDVILINSFVWEAKKTLYWEGIHSWDRKIIIGTRSALFYPYKDLWMVIIDEEHDESYISENSPKYDGIEVAEFLFRIYGSRLVLASGTPKVAHFYDALQKKYEIHYLLQTYQ